MGPEFLSFIAAALLSVALMVAPTFIGDLPKWAMAMAFWMGLAGFLWTGVAAIRLWVAKDGDTGRALLLGATFGLGLLATVSLLGFLNHQPAPERPGFGLFMVIRIADQQVDRRRYVFELGKPNAVGAAFYRSASDKFIFEVRDDKGEAYPLEIPRGKAGIPIAEFIILRAQAAVEGKKTVLEVYVDRKLVGRRTLPFPLDLSKAADTRDFVLGANNKGQENGAFDLGEYFTTSVVLSDENIEGLMKYLEKKWGLGD